MKFLVRVSIAIMVLSVGAFVLPRPAARVVGGDALAQPVPTPTVPGVLPEPSPSPSKPPGGGGGGGGGGGNKPGALAPPTTPAPEAVRRPRRDYRC